MAKWMFMMACVVGAVGCVAESSEPTIESAEAEASTRMACGPTVGRDCGEGLYCQFGIANLCGEQAPGTCTQIPTRCTRDIDYVCGCDGITYVNECNAKTEGASIAHRGPCR